MFLALFFASLIIKNSRKNKVFPIAFLTGVAAVSVYFINLNLNIQPIKTFDETDAVISGTIFDIPYKKNNRYNYTIKVENLNKEKIKPFKIKLTSPEAIEGNIYDKFTGSVHFYVPQNNPAFDSEIYYRAKNIYINAFLYNYEENFTQKPEKIPPYYYILKLREKMLSASKRLFPVRPASVINGILLGERHEFPEDVRTSFEANGVFHLLATSGVHIAILSQFFLWLFKKLKFGNRFAAISSAVAVLIFMALTCFTPSVTRAGIMAMIYLLGLAIFKKPDSLNSLGIAVLLICAFSPNSALDIGLWLSFLSTLGIIILYKNIDDFLKNKLKKINFKENKIINYIIASISVSLSAWAFTLPVLAWFFRKTSIISPISNIILIPPVTIMLNLSLIVNILSILDAPTVIVYPPALLCGILTNIIIYISNLLSKIPFAMISLDYGIANLSIAFILFFIAIGLYAKNLKKSFKFITILSLNLAFFSAFTYQINKRNVTDATVLNVSDGIGFVISKNSKRAAILCLSENSSTTDIENYLSQSYVKDIDYLSIPILTDSNKTFAQNILETYSPKTTSLSTKNSAELNIEKTRTNPIYFSGNLKSAFWEDVQVETFEINEHTYIGFTISDIKFLIIANGGNADDIPENFKNCDFLIINGLPVNYQKINSKNYIISMNKTDSEINATKLISSSKNTFSCAQQGRIYISIDSGGKYSIRRSL